MEPRTAPRAGELRLFLKRHPTTQRLGFTFDNTSVPGFLTINSIDKGSSADGKIFIGDRLLAVDGQRVGSLHEAYQLCADCDADMVEVIVSDDSRVVVVERATARDEIGLGLEACNYPRPVRITRVDAGSYAEAAGLAVGDWIVSVNGTRTSDQQQCVRLVTQTPHRALKFKVRSAATLCTAAGAPAGAPSAASTPRSSGGVVGFMVRSLSFSKRGARKNSGSETSPSASERSTDRASAPADEALPTGGAVPELPMQDIRQAL